MQKIVICTKGRLKNKEWIGYDFEDRTGMFVFSVTDSSAVPGKPKDYYTVTVRITGELLKNWKLIHSSENDIIKVLFYYAMEHVYQSIEKSISGNELPASNEVVLTTKNHTETRCPVVISEIPKIFDFGFNVNVREQGVNSANQSLKGCLQDFAKHISTEKRMTFWQPGSTIDKKWISHPEKHAKNLLQAFLSGRFGNAIYTFEEISSGAGKVDLFIIFPSDEKAVVELKMCGHNYSMTYAQEGDEQLLHYMENRGAKMGYLLIFDSRVRDFGRGFQDFETINGMPFVNIVVDVKPYVKQKEAPSDV